MKELTVSIYSRDEAGTPERIAVVDARDAEKEIEKYISEEPEYTYFKLHRCPECFEEFDTEGEALDHCGYVEEEDPDMYRDEL